MTSFLLKGRRVWVTGHRGMVGSALLRRLAHEECELLTATRSELDLRRQAEVEDWVDEYRPDVVFISAATVGGIHANNARPTEFLYDNLMIAANVIEAAHRRRVGKLLFLGSSCIYPKHAPQPMREEALLTGPLEETNQWYAIAKIAGLKLCAAHRREHGDDFISAMPTNLYGPGDTFHLLDSHVIPALMLKMHNAVVRGEEVVEIWGTGHAKREFLYVDDLADALVHLVKTYFDEPHINIGTGTDLAIADLAALIAKVVGFNGSFAFASDKPDGTPRKLLDVSRLTALGWRASTDLESGLRATYAWFLRNQPALASA